MFVMNSESISALERMLTPYNPWWGKRDYKVDPSFRRLAFQKIFQDLKEIRQIISITGPRRVGKTTLVHQLVEALIAEGHKPEHIIYFSLDDPLLLEKPFRERFFEDLMEWIENRCEGKKCFLFLDEVQRFEAWELYLKKYYDLNFNVRFTISGSASSPIFKKSRDRN